MQELSELSLPSCLHKPVTLTSPQTPTNEAFLAIGYMKPTLVRSEHPTMHQWLDNYNFEGELRRKVYKSHAEEDRRTVRRLSLATPVNATTTVNVQ